MQFRSRFGGHFGFGSRACGPGFSFGVSGFGGWVVEFRAVEGLSPGSVHYSAEGLTLLSPFNP